MSTDRRSVLKGLAAAGLMVAGVPWAQATATADTSATEAVTPITLLVSGGALDAAFVAGVQQASDIGQAQSSHPLHGLDAKAFDRLSVQLRDGEATLLVGLLDDASAVLVLDLVRSAGGQVLSVQHHRAGHGMSAQQWAHALGQSLVKASLVPLAPAVDQGAAYVSIRCVI